ncbi:PTS sugar transporter subunit IIC [Escherichia coli]|nr:PTS sugar transporter subunit IIC [Escherichia coli]
MEISLLQAFALGIIAFIAGLDMFNGLTHIHRPVVLGPLVGLVLGDLHTGILTGGTLELVWMGLALLALGTFYFLCAFLPIYFGAEHAKTIIDVLPQRLIDGLGVAGGIMPAIGFAVLLKIMMKNVYIPYFILGFVAAAWLKLPVLAIAAAALAMALIDLLRKSPEPTQPAAQKEEFEDGI